MIPVVSQIERVASVRASAGNAGLLRPAPQAIRSNAPAEAAKNADRETARPAPVGNDHGLRLSVRPDTHEVIATLVDTETNEVIRQIPGEETQRAAEVIRGIAGQLLDKIA